ncbi:MAG: helix-turn-helix domain-containing protein, partial [Acidobacteriota bacterium]
MSNLFAILNLLGALQAALFAGALLGVKRGNISANRIFATLLLIISILITWGVLFYTRYLLLIPHLAQLHVPFQFLIAPLLFFYFRVALNIDTSFGRKTLWHFIPFVICALYLVPFYLQSEEYKLLYLKLTLERFPIELYVRTSLLLLLGLVYLIYIWKLILNYRRHFDQVSTMSKSDFYSVYIWVWVFTIVWIVSVIRLVFDYRVESNYIVPLLFTIFVCFTVFVRLRHCEILPESNLKNLPTKKYEKSTLTLARAERYSSKLLELMESEKPYTDPELTLAKLADMLAISSHHLSQIINERLNQNFFDFINAYRVKEAQRMLIDPKHKHLSIIAIANEVGFNSKSAFNLAFKKYVQMTPSEWRKSCIDHNLPQEQTSAL